MLAARSTKTAEKDIAKLDEEVAECCRMLQEDSKNVAEQEQIKRQELSNKLQDTISDVSTRLDEQGTERIEQFKENERCCARCDELDASGSD